MWWGLPTHSLIGQGYYEDYLKSTISKEMAHACIEHHKLTTNKSLATIINNNTFT